MTFSVLAWVPGGFSRFVFAKLLVVAIACALGATVAARSRVPIRITVLLVTGAVVFSGTALLGDTPIASLIGRWPRYEGLPMLGMYAASGWLGARLINSRSRVDQLVGAVAAMACVLGVISILDAIGWSPLGPSTVTRDGSLLGNATDQGLVAMMAVAILVRPAVDTRRELYLFGLGLALSTVVLSNSRFALLATVAVLVGLALARRRSLMWPLLGMVGVLMVMVLAVPQSRERLTNTHTIRGRWLAWDLSWDMVLDRPLLGWGASRYVDAFGGYETREWVEWAGTRTVPDSPHNWLLQVTLAGGVALLVCALALVVVGFWFSWQNLRERPELAGIFAAVAGYSAAMVVNFTIASSTCLAAFLAGALVSRPVKAPEPKGRRVAATAIAGTTAALLAVLCISEVVLQRGLVAAGEGRPGDAGRAFHRAAMLRPADPDSDMIAAQALAMLANDRRLVPVAVDAEGHARASLIFTPDTYESQVALGVARMVQEDLAGAQNTLDRAITQFPFRPSAYIQRAIARYGLGDVDGARKDLRFAIDLGSRSARTVLRQISRQAG